MLWACGHILLIKMPTNLRSQIGAHVLVERQSGSSGGSLRWLQGSKQAERQVVLRESDIVL